MSEVPTGWVLVPISQVARLENGDRSKNYPSKQHRTASGVPFINAGHLKNGLVSQEAMDYISRERFEMLSSGKTRDGDVLFCLRGSLGKTALVRDIPDGAIASSLVIVRPSEALSSKYLYYYLSSPFTKSAIARFDNGTAQPNLAARDLGRFLIPVAPAKEQGRIVAAIEEQFSRLDSSIAALHRAQQNLNRMKVALLQTLIMSYPTPDLASAPVRNAELPQLPDGWRWTNLGDLIAEGPQNGLYLPASSYGSGVPILRINDFQSDWARPKEGLRLVSPGPEQAKMFALAAGDLVVNRVNSMTHLGKCMIVSNDLAGALFESNIMRIRLSDEIMGRYLALYLRSPLGRSFLLKNAKWAVNQASINQSDVKATPIAVPPYEQQQRIFSVYDIGSRSLFRIAEDIQTSLRRSNSLRSSILEAAFSGKLVGQDSSEESSSALLDRIETDGASSNPKKSRQTRQSRGRRMKVTP